MSATRSNRTWPAHFRLANHIAGRSVAGGGDPLPVSTPITGDPVATLQTASLAELDEAIEAARLTFDRGIWAARPTGERAAVLRGTATRLRAQADTLVPLIMLDNGKTRGEAVIDVMAAAAAFEAGAESCVAATVRDMGVERGVERTISREPVGVVAGITPFNAPLMFVALKAAPALAAGNSVVLKPSERAPLVPIAVCDAAAAAGLPPGVLSLVQGDASLAARLAEDPRVDMITLTGGTAAGQAVMRAAATTIKRVLLELGGKSANIILADADLEMAVPAAAAAIFRNAGQRCLSGSRLLVQARVADEVEARLTALASALRVGDPFEDGTEVGAVIDERAMTAIDAFITCATNDPGVMVAAGGQRVETLRPGSFFRPTVLTVIRVADADEAVHVANDSAYGLTGAVWTRDTKLAMAMAREIRTGYFWINTFGAVFGDMPFGGFKASGLGREAGQFGYESYTELKSIMLDTTGGTTAPLF